MPTVNLGAPTTTGRWGGSTWQNSPFGWDEYTGTTYQPGARWASVPVPRGAVIIAATLAFSVGGTGVTGARAVGRCNERGGQGHPGPEVPGDGGE